MNERWKPKSLILHHSGESGSPESIAALGYYHIVVSDDQPGPRQLMSVPNDRPSSHAVGGYNSVSWSLCVVGNYKYRRPSDKLLPYLIQIFAARAKAYGVHPEHIYSHGYVGRHLVAFGARYSTECCGTHLEALLPAIRAGVARYLR